MDEKTLSIISNETKNSIDELSIVTPSVYASIFKNYAKEHNISLEEESQFSAELIKQECDHFTQLQQQTSKNVEVLNRNTSKAIDAIKEKDDSILSDILKETQALKEEIDKLKATMYKDELTHAFNRKWLHDNFFENGTTTMNTQGTLAIFDLNYFKQINDTHGHLIGDKVLIFFASQLKKLSPNVIRYGGDEFVIIFPQNSNEEMIATKINALRETILTKKLKAHETTFHVSFSFGVSSFQKGNEISLIIEKADKNMYLDKTHIKKRITGI